MTSDKSIEIFAKYFIILDHSMPIRGHDWLIICYGQHENLARLRDYQRSVNNQFNNKLSVYAPS